MNDPARKIQCFKYAAAAVLMLLSGACQSPAPQATPSVAPPVTAPQSEGVAAPAATPPAEPSAEPPPAAAPLFTAAAWSDLSGWTQDNHAEALPALLASCRVLAKQAAWREACDAAQAARNLNVRDAARRFFEQHFTPHRVTNPDGTPEGLATGYFEPIIRGSRTRSPRNRYPVYGAPADIVPLESSAESSHITRGRLDGGRVAPYYTRAQIDTDNSPLRGREIAWVEDAMDLFFLQVQGSGRITLAEGGVMRIGFAEHNGHPYRSIGRVLIERGDLSADRASMQGIKAWARANPARQTELLNQNPRYVFFRELTGPATSPPGALGVPLTPERSVAIDPRYVPLGAPVHIATTWPNTDRPLQRLMLAQDTGGAIRGAVRIDYFWGAGDKAALEAGRMQQSVRVWVLLPNGHAVPEAKP
jgi:membrane-bound lytic murein transglycosylase A